MCNNPNHLFILGIDPNTGKKSVKVTPKQYNVIACKTKKASIFPEDWFGCELSCFDPKNKGKLIRPEITDFYEIPCGKCTACLQKKSRDWTTRMTLELPYYQLSSDIKLNEVWFVTLTYNDNHLPTRYTYDSDGVQIDNWLNKSPIQNFIKRVRKKAMEQHSADPTFQFKYYCTCELGSKTHRLHYHLILFGIRLPDVCSPSDTDDLDIQLRPSGRNENPYYYSKFLESKWSDYLGNNSKNEPIYGEPYGFVTLGLVNQFTMKYVAKYSTKNGNLWHLQSSRPSLGRRFFDDNYKKIFEDKKVIYNTESLTIQQPIPRYYIYLIKRDVKQDFLDLGFFCMSDEFTDSYNEWTTYIDDCLSPRMNAIKRDEMSSTSLSRNDYLEVKERNLSRKVSEYRQRHDYF